MLVYCSNCNTAHSISHDEMRKLKDPVISCRGCDKKIKMQFCPECGAFYSITFSNIQPGNYKYHCKKCGGEFTITIPSPAHEHSAPREHNRSTAPALTRNETAKPSITFTAPPAAPEVKTAPAPAKEDITFMQNSINTFTVSELLSLTGTAFSIKKIVPSAAAALIMLLIVRIFTMIQGIISPSLLARSETAALFLNLLPAAIIFSFYTVAAAVVAKITLERIFYNREPQWDDISKFSLKKAPGIFLCNVVVMLLVNMLLVLFGRIPLLGPVLFSLAFLPVYLISICIALFFFAGLWFYPPIAAHRESRMFMNLKDLAMFIRKHNLSLIYMVPAAAALTVIAFSAIFIIHTAALTLTISISRAVLSSGSSSIFSGIPALFVKISETAMTGVNSSIFRQLNPDINMSHHAGGLVLGISITIITVLLISIFFSITATVSTHIYIMMERGLTVDDRRKALTMLILVLFMTVFILVRRIL